MGRFYLRKSLRVGPVRFNLSKSGVGISAGVRGARVGISSTGRAYLHAGAKGIYYRKTLGSAGTRGSQGLLAGRPEPITLYEDTGVTFPARPAPPSRPSLRAKLEANEASLSVYLLLPLVGILLIVLPLGLSSGGLSAAQAIAVIGGVLLVIGWPVPLWNAWQRRRATRRAEERLLRAIESVGRPLSLENVTDIERYVEDSADRGDRDRRARLAYLQLVCSLASGGRIGAEEINSVELFADRLAIGPNFRLEARIEAFCEAFLAAVVDHELSRDEERALREASDKLDIPVERIEGELEIIDRLGEMRRIREGTLPVVESSMRLKKSEICHYEAPGRMLKERNLRSFQQDGQKYKVRGLVLDKEGALLITSERILLVHAGASSIRMDKVIELEVDDDRNLLRITKDGASTPVLISTPDAFKAGTIVAAVAGL